MAEQPGEVAAERQKCRFRLYSGIHCDREPVPGHHLCIAHLEDRTAEQDREFEALVASVISEGHCDFSGFVFPRSFEGFRNARFASKAWFNGAVFPGDATFTGSTFEKDAVFCFASVRGTLWFDCCKVLGGANFSTAEIGEEAYLYASEVGRDVNFSAARVGANANLNSAKVTGGLDFAHTVVGGDMSLWDLKCGGRSNFLGASISGGLSMFRTQFGDSVCLLSTRIGGDLDLWDITLGHEITLRGARITGSTIVHSSEFQQDVSFEDAQLCGPVRLFGAKFHGHLDFSGAASPSSGRFENVSVPNGLAEPLWRFAKQVYETMGQYDLAGECHYQECWDRWFSKRQNRRMRVQPWLRKKPICGRLSNEISGLWAWLCGLPEQVGPQWVFGYGERPLNPLKAGAAVILVASLFCFAFAPYLQHADDPGRMMSYFDALYFSIVTFTTLGFGEWHPKPGSYIALVPMVEALAGAILMSLFVVCLARRWGRG